jgi:hypothetical protein
MAHVAELVLDVALNWWRVTTAVVASLLLAGSIQLYASIHSVGLTLSLMLAGLVCGGAWHRRSLSDAAGKRSAGQDT